MYGHCTCILCRFRSVLKLQNWHSDKVVIAVYSSNIYNFTQPQNSVYYLYVYMYWYLCVHGGF